MTYLTQHAKERFTARCIPEIAIGLLQDIGLEYFDHDGRLYYQLTNLNEKQRVAGELKKASRALLQMANKLEKKDGLFLVTGNNGVVVTAGHHYSRHRN